MKIHLLFICSGDKCRSPAAADLFKRSDNYIARSAGTHLDARKRVTQKLLDWADLIFVMSEGTNRHLTYIKSNFIVKKKRIYDLHVRDMYFRNDSRLHKLLKQRISKIIDF
jgi:protein-tyrosine phosphatase